jgi:DNA invertase Pin-like site-specific DNA recombinase
MSERARRGYRKARAKGKRIGAPRLSPSKENRVAALLQAGVCPHRVRTLTNVGKAAIYRIKRDLECKPSDVEQH